MMALYYLIAIILVAAPWLLFIGLAVLSSSFDDSVAPKKSRAGLCTSPGCIRCNKNKHEFLQGLSRFNALYKGEARCERIRRGFKTSNEPREELFFKMNFQASRPVWSRNELSSSIVKDLEFIESSRAIIIAECEKALKCACLWRRNEEQSSSHCWFTFNLINQGCWQEDQCQVCFELVKLLHQMNTLLVGCIFGNAFISMLPQNSVIAEHRGMTNVRLRMHYGVEIPADPEHCFMVVGGEKFNWNDGSSVVFDDSFPHSVSSQGCKEDRIVLTLDLWHPELGTNEKDCLSRVFPAAY